MKKNIIKSISIAILIAFTTTCVPLNSLAKESNSNLPKLNNKKEQVKAKILKEDISKREKFTKHYLMSDGSYKAITSNEAMHYKESGKWKNIDNSLNKITDSKGRISYKNKSNLFDVHFADKVTDDSLVEISKDQYTLSWNIENIEEKVSADATPAPDNISSVASPVIDSPNKKISDNPRKVKIRNAKAKVQNPIQEEIDDQALPKQENSIEYNNIVEDVDIKYDVKPEQIKESIIINQVTDITSFTFKISHNGLSLKKKDKDYVFVDNNNQPVFYMSKFFMQDAKDQYSEDITVDIQNTEDGSVITVTPSQKWLNDSKRSYPIVIDPIISSSMTGNNFRGTYVFAYEPQSNNYNQAPNAAFPVGGKSFKGFYKVNNLPIIKGSEVITNAKFRFTPSYQGSLPDYPVYIYDCLGVWDLNTITWNNMPGIGNVVDHVLVNRTDVDYVTDITTSVTKWYKENKNTGLMVSTAIDNTVTLQAAAYFEMTYVDRTGLENYMSYQTHNAGRAGTGHVNYYNGNLAYVHPDVATSGLRMPVSIEHVYNSMTTVSQYVQGNSGTSPVISDSTFGIGWKTNMNQTVTVKMEDASNPAYYIWTDGDGTAHYFIKNNESSGGNRVWQCEDIPDYALTVNQSNRIVIYDKQNTCMEFDSNTGLLQEIYDSQEDSLSKRTNKIKINYDSGNRISSVRDAAGKVIIFNYTNGKLSNIVDNRNRTIQYAYTADRLTKITYPDGKESSYTYNSDNQIVEAKNMDGYWINYNYSSDGKVSGLKEISNNSVQRTSLTFEYGQGSTKVTDGQNNWTEMGFNNQGNVVSGFDSEGYAGSSVFDTEAGSKSRFKALSVNNPRKSVQNLLLLGNFNHQSNWSPSKGNVSCEYTTQAGYLGEGCYEFKNNATYNGEKGKLLSVVNLDTNKTYTLSAYVYSNNYKLSGDYGFKLSASNMSGSKSYQSSLLNEQGKWTRMSLVFDTNGISGSKVYMNIEAQMDGILLYKGSSVLIDSIQLEEGESINAFNLLDISDFTNSDVSPYYSWIASGGNPIVLDNGEGIKGLDKYVWNITGNHSQDLTLSQTLQLNGKKDDSFTMGGFMKGFTDKNVTIELEFVPQSGSNSVGENKIIFEKNRTGWQHGVVTVSAPTDYTAVMFKIHTNKAVGTMNFDGMYLYKEKNSVDIKYDENGNPSSVGDENGIQTNLTYDSNHDLTKSNTNNNSTNYSYDDNHNQTNEKAVDGVSTKDNYDIYGNILSSFQYPASSSPNPTSGPYIKTESEYYTDDEKDPNGFADNTGNYLKSQTDEKGNKTEYDYNKKSGLLNSVNSADGNITKYDYDSNTDALTKVTSGSSSNSYTYENDMIKTISSQKSTFTFTYDGFGNNTQVMVGNKALVQNSYNPSTGELTNVQYGNGDTIGYIYDSTGNIKSYSVNGNTRFKYFYNVSGSIGRKEDLENNITYQYEYDSSGRLIKTEDSKGNKSWSEFDDQSTNKKTEKYDFIAFTNKLFKSTSILNSTGNPEKESVQQIPNVYGTPAPVNKAEISKQYTYDSLGRLTKESYGVKASEAPATALPTLKYEANYIYEGYPGSGEPNRTTNSVKSITFKKGAEEKNRLTYTYDEYL